MSKLAMMGGDAAVPRDKRKMPWPVVTEADEKAVLAVLAGGKLVANSGGEKEVGALEEEWAEQTGSRYCVAVSSGTSALTLALAAARLEPGDEILVPALSFVASAVAPLHEHLVPRFVDIDPHTFNLDPRAAAARVTARTRAIMVVHLHGLPADMDEIREVARRHDALVVEDAAQAHGATYRGRPVGSLSDVAAFSLHCSKNLPTCGEGGLITTDNPEIYRLATLLRQFGHSYGANKPRMYVSELCGFNYKPNPIQAAFARSQLTRFHEYQAIREHNVGRFLGALADLPGILCPRVPEDRTHVWHILRLRFDPVAAGFDDVSPGSFSQALQRALNAEGVPMTPYQVLPLPAQRIFHEHQNRRGIAEGYSEEYRAEDYPNTLAVIEDSLTLQKFHLNPTSGPLLEHYAEAFCKVWENLDLIARMARSRPYKPPWHEIGAGSVAKAPPRKGARDLRRDRVVSA